MRIRWTRQARADIDAAFEYVAADNIRRAEQTVERIQEAAAILARHPTAVNIQISLNRFIDDVASIPVE